MKIRLLSIITCVVLLCLFFCGCRYSDKTNNQHSTNEVVSEPFETIGTNPKDNPNGEPEVNFSDLL